MTALADVLAMHRYQCIQGRCRCQRRGEVMSVDDHDGHLAAAIVAAGLAVTELDSAGVDVTPALCPTNEKGRCRCASDVSKGGQGLRASDVSAQQSGTAPHDSPAASAGAGPVPAGECVPPIPPPAGRTSPQIETGHDIGLSVAAEFFPQHTRSQK